jgi:CCR4-NOT transcription complex subunit 6
VPRSAAKTTPSPIPSNPANLLLILVPPQLPLTSAYSTIWDASNAHDGKLAKQKQRLDSKLHEPHFTNVSKDFRGTLDYILFTNNSLVPTAVLELPAESEVVSGNEHMPNAQYSSDHLALLAEFQYVR